MRQGPPSVPSRNAIQNSVLRVHMLVLWRLCRKGIPCLVQEEMAHCICVHVLRANSLTASPAQPRVCPALALPCVEGKSSAQSACTPTVVLALTSGGVGWCTSASGVCLILASCGLFGVVTVCWQCLVLSLFVIRGCWLGRWLLVVACKPNTFIIYIKKEGLQPSELQGVCGWASSFA